MLMTGALSLLKDLFKVTGTTPQTAVLMAVNDTFGQAAQNAINVLLPKLGMPFRLVDTITYDPQAKDLSVEVAKAKAPRADLHIGVTWRTVAVKVSFHDARASWEALGRVKMQSDSEIGERAVNCGASSPSLLDFIFLDDPPVGFTRALDSVVMLAVGLRKLANDLIKVAGRRAMGIAATEPDLLPQAKSML
jgi:hypothetical protein